MANFPSDELFRYWTILTPDQKQSLLAVVRSFLSSPRTGEQVLQEPDPVYTTANDQEAMALFQKMTKEQAQSLISLMQSFDVDTEAGIAIEEYNRELDEAMKAMDAGAFYTHEQVVEMSKTWLKNGK